jgi:hypothetical protein
MNLLEAANPQRTRDVQVKDIDTALDELIQKGK